jgi:endonuclease YncB( thermonuclease family)
MTDLKPSQLFEKLTAKVTIFDQHLFWFKAQLKPTKQDPSGVHDGDTVNAVIDYGDFTYRQKPLRVANINAPELSTQAGQVAKQWAIQWFNTNVGSNGYFYIHTHLDPEDKYGRFLAMIYAPGGECFNDDIVNAGMAIPYLVEPF